MMNALKPTTEISEPFVSHRWIRGGDLQTIFSAWEKVRFELDSHRQVVEVTDGDCIALHFNEPHTRDQSGKVEPQPPFPETSKGVVLLVHGISGCHQSSYMVRIASGLLRDGWTTCRLDMRGCGSVADLSSNVSHAGRSDDVAVAINEVAKRYPHRPIHVMGVSLGGNQSIRLLGRIGAAAQTSPSWYEQFSSLVAIAPPIDLLRCSDNMQRLRNRIYNRFFIRELLSRAPARIRDRIEFRSAMQGAPIRTLRDLDDRLTAPLSGFAGYRHYYEIASSQPWIESIGRPTLILAAEDDPIVPADIFDAKHLRRSNFVNVQMTRGGGHAGYIGPGGSRAWLDDTLVAWFNSHAR
jgi:uncharacterized protein